MDLVARYLDHVRFEKRLAERTVTLYTLDLEKLVDYAAHAHVALEAVQSMHIRRWVAQMHSGGRSGRGIALILSGWRGFYVWLGRQGLVSNNPVQDVRAPKAPKPLPKALSVDDAVQLADGGKSHLGRILGRTWHQETVYGVASRAYATSPMADDPWITSHLELRDTEGTLQAGYGWIFPLGTGEVNIGVGTLATSKRPAPGALRPLLDLYTDQRRSEWQWSSEIHSVASALLPMGGAVSNIAGRNWAVIGDAAACVNPLNGEGIDYGLEGGRLVVEQLGADDLTELWPTVLREHYGQAFSVARRLAGLLTVPQFLPASGPIAMRSRALMTVAVRVMGNLVTDADADLTAKAWRASGAASRKIDSRPLFG